MIYRTKKNKNYTVISNKALNDPSLSLKAKGLWAFIMAKPDKWNFTIRSAASELKESKNTVERILKELEIAGYLVRGIVRQKDGKFTSGENIMYEEPCPHYGDPDNGVTNKVLNIVSTTLRGGAETPEPTFSSGAVATLSVGSPADSDDSAPTVNALHYRVIKKYSLPVSNHREVPVKSKALETEIGEERAKQYLQRLLDVDYQALEGEFKPSLSHSRDIYNKRLQIMTFVEKFAPTSTAPKTYVNKPLFGGENEPI